MTFEKLLDEAAKDNINVIEMKFKGNIKGLYCNNTIAISKKLKTDAEKTCVLAEEMGHHHTSSGNILEQSNINNIKQEKIARNWAYKKLVGITSLIRAYKSGVRNRYELAEFLNVTEDFLEEALKYYKEKYGTYYAIDNYVICFDPLAILEMF
ncbi:ImmA/IrrE family metallo-endopeptidase [Caloramator australicus]|uniref:Gp23-like protein n=1 Tax=Caloramator australicus RC3 TaxID=857293 RepID=I7KT56_9CLOT|nr:ImmA/IrrE family metallo-endopeptidase [Caloramator australicus]CCJ32848.1 gp23-like protein [Caloramator australicus RC3]